MSAAMNQRVPDHVHPNHVFDFDMYGDPSILDDLHVAYARVCASAPPVFYTPANGGHWIITRHDDIVSVVTDPEHFSAREMNIPRVPNPPLLIPLNLDPPDNIPYRRILMPFFSPKAIGEMSKQIEKHAKATIAAVAKDGTCNFVDDVSARFPVTVFMEFMGFPLDRFDDFRLLAEAFFRAVGDEAVHRAAEKIAVEMVAVIQLRMREPKDDLLSKLVAADIDGRKLSMDELVPICMLLFFGGLDTVTNASSFGARFLAENPQLQERLINEPALIEPFVEETIRMFGVVNTPRIVRKDCERFGVKFRAGDMVLCNLPLAGWDKSKNAHPEIFDIDRKNRSYLIFSTGPHLCLGHFLARVEMRMLFTEWMQQIGRFRLAKGYKPPYRAGMVMALDALQLEWTPKS
ncbi:MAG: cytochrome P450 [Steroidobacteraceae bacterium]